MLKFQKSASPTESLQGEKDLFHFDVSAALVRRAAVPAKKGAAWKDTADQWVVTVTQRECGNAVSLDYWSGYGCRAFKAGLARDTIAFYETSIPVEPTAASILSCIGMEWQSLADLPNEEGAALDDLAAESGFEKPSEALGALRGLRANADKVQALLRNTGVQEADFAAWASELSA